MGDDFLHSLTPRLRALVTGPGAVFLGGVSGFAVLVAVMLVVLGGRNHSAAAASSAASARAASTPAASSSAAPASAASASASAASASASAASASAAPASAESALVADQMTAGRQLFVVHCSSCHGVDAEGTTNGPSLIHAGAASADFYLRTGRMPLNDPHQQPVRHAPAFPPDQISDLVAYIGSLDAGTPIPTVLPGNLAAGNELFSQNCAQCHNDAGAGGALGYGDIVPPLRKASPLDVVEAARIGPAPMPVFSPKTLSDQQVSNIAAYVQYLHHPEDRGGLGLGHLGPIPEGFVGWVVGMGALLLIARLIGTRG
jgi:ubiquinol-cytochrome c reductase cytochrome c subunit